jgi:hypothetical protein
MEQLYLGRENARVENPQTRHAWRPARLLAALPGYDTFYHHTRGIVSGGGRATQNWQFARFLDLALVSERSKYASGKGRRAETLAAGTNGSVRGLNDSKEK